MTAAAASMTVMVPQGRGGRIMTVSDGGGSTAAFSGGSTPNFSDLIDIINPLQHIPVINTVYRALTGDHESAMADIIGGTLYGGPIGGAAAMADLGLRDATGKTAGEHVVAWLGGGKDTPPATATAVAAAQPVTAPATVNPPAVARSNTTQSIPAAAAATQAAPDASAPQAPAAKTATASPVHLAPASLTVDTSAGPAVSAVPVAATGEAGPMSVGDYLVFGSGTASAPSPSASANAKTFATIGAGAQPATALPAVQSMAALPAAQVPAAAQAPQKIFRVPPRNGPATPTAFLPPPTTGPGALPGGKSMALTAQEISVQQDPQRNFLTAYTQALDKYRSAQRLAASQNGTAPTAPLVQPAAAVVPAEAAEQDENAVTLH